MLDLKNFVAVNDKRPGQESFKVSGTVTVNHPGVTPVLVEPQIRHKGGWEVLNLEFSEADGIHPAVLVDKTVTFERAGGTAWQAVEIRCGDNAISVPINTLE